MKNVKVGKWVSLIAGILLIIAGVIYLFNPLNGALAIIKFMAALLIVIGILRIIRYFSHDAFRTGGFLVSGILDIILGVVMLINPAASVISLTFVVGMWVLLSGIIEAANSFDLMRLGVSRWWIGLISGILGVVLGFMLIGDFGLTAFYISLMGAFYMFSLGGALISGFFSLKRFEDNYKDSFSSQE